MAFKPALRSSMRLKPAAVLAVLMAIQTCLTAQVSSPLLHGLLVLGATGRSLSPAATRRGPAGCPAATGGPPPNRVRGHGPRVHLSYSARVFEPPGAGVRGRRGGHGTAGLGNNIVD